MEAEARDALGRDYYERGAEDGRDYRNGHRLGRLKTAEDAMSRVAERWRAIRFTDFERRQIAAVRKELEAEYAAADTTPSASQQARRAPKFSAAFGLDLRRRNRTLAKA